MIKGHQVNALLRTAQIIEPSGDGERELTLLALALCMAARSCGVDREEFIEQLTLRYDDVLTRELVPLENTRN